MSEFVSMMPYKGEKAMAGHPHCEYENDGQRIIAPGKFEGEPVFAPWFWEKGLDGLADSDDGKVFAFRIQLNGIDKDNPFRPELKKWLGRRRVLRMQENEQGFVSCF